MRSVETWTHNCHSAKDLFFFFNKQLSEVYSITTANYQCQKHPPSADGVMTHLSRNAFISSSTVPITSITTNLEKRLACCTVVHFITGILVLSHKYNPICIVLLKAWHLKRWLKRLKRWLLKCNLFYALYLWIDTLSRTYFSVSHILLSIYI